MRHQDFNRLLAALAELNPARIEDVASTLGEMRRRKEAIALIEGRVQSGASCPHCGETRRRKWGRARVGAQRYRCAGCGRTYSGRTGSEVGRVRRPDLFPVVLRDTLEAVTPLPVRKLARRLGLNKSTTWRWRVRILPLLPDGLPSRLVGIIEADGTHQRESRRGPREWVRHLADPQNVPAPPRPRWKGFTTNGISTMRGLSQWQLPILTVADRGGTRHFRRLRGRRGATLEAAMAPLVHSDAILCSDGASAYAKVAANEAMAHVVVGSRPGSRVVGRCHHVQTVNPLHGQHGHFLRPFRGPATKNLDGYIRWFEARLNRVSPSVISGSA